MTQNYSYKLANCQLCTKWQKSTRQIIPRSHATVCDDVIADNDLACHGTKRIVDIIFRDDASLKNNRGHIESKEVDAAIVRDVDILEYGCSYP